ncbi:DUF6163 family protein [Methylorubrum zatmanii]|uniref:DUF6163 family protein n=1 Tax=Methylorubrum zatmanii TaxID=29429 RepID=A0ABW1WLI2_9HYPH|nr:DUF6163 family protein [Methylorubrum zatmanii]MBD8908819.1 hypothetical protein [Methylorubrum zatmanii]
MRALTKVGATRDGRGRPSSGAGDRIEGSAPKEQTRWDVVLVWFMRVTALIWLAKGLVTWGEILDLLPGRTPFAELAPGRQSAIVYFAVIDFVAAVGLWLTSAWGGVVWLLAATSALTLAVLTPQLLPMSMPVIAIQASIVAVYFVLSWLAARDVG